VSTSTNIALIVGARPNMVKAAALVDAHREAAYDWSLDLIHTGQHYDDRLSRCFIEQLRLPQPVAALDVGAGSISVQTARIIERIEPVFASRRPAGVLVVGDVTSTIAAALTAKRLGIPVAHVEAGLRSFDRTMPEEINRILTDAIADLLFVTEPSGLRNLAAEGVAAERVHFVGNPMIDTLFRYRDTVLPLHMCQRVGAERGEYVLVTLHRPSNVDDPAKLRSIVDMLEAIAADHDVVFPVHPRTAAKLESVGVTRGSASRLHLIDPQPYFEFISLVLDAGAVLTDSGGLQEETTALGVPCVTLRTSTERPVTVDVGTNLLVGDQPAAALAAIQRVFGRRAEHRVPEKWDGRAGARILDVVDYAFADHSRSFASSPTSQS
jgi:UDP-N-acetylglucosamine 2-epimerase (non-hydrolysing)